MGDYHNGYRDGRTVSDDIIALKIINEKLWEYDQSVQYLFIDFQKAYFSIHTDTLWKCMKEFEILTKLRNMRKTCVQETKSEFRIEGTLSSFFFNKKGLKQGAPLSPISFNLLVSELYF